ncbi:hypothetical protein AKH19_00925 [Pelagibacteraceae bacterium GOM-A1]|nr:hypothetical protein AKH19_00925 [Pelagibacteraceae bacterium GOM-A1]
MIKTIKKIFKKNRKPEDTLYRVIDDLLDEKQRMKNTIDLLRKQLNVESTVYSPAQQLGKFTKVK